MNNEKQETQPKRWTEICQLIYDWGGWSSYDNPADAERFGCLDHSYLGYEGWRRWKRDHYVGADGYDHKTGKIIHPELRKFFDRWYPDFEERQREKAEQQREDGT